MRNQVYALIILLGTCFAVSANAQDVEVMDTASCRTTIKVDSGNTAKRAIAQWGCLCQHQSCHQSNISGSCPSGTTDFGPVVTGGRCCHWTQHPCLREDESAEAEPDLVLEGTTDTGLGAVFGTNFDDERTAYYAIVNSVNRSPSGGRGNSVTAKLDACVGHGNTNNMSSLSDCINNYCPNSNLNSYCQATAQNNGSSTPYGICKDRCECQFGSGNCENK